MIQKEGGKEAPGKQSLRSYLGFELMTIGVDVREE